MANPIEELKIFIKEHKPKKICLNCLQFESEVIDYSKDNRRYYATLMYDIQTEDGIYTLFFPKVDLGVNNRQLPSIVRLINRNTTSNPQSYYCLDLFDNMPAIRPDKDGNYYHLNKIMSTKRKVTISDIEKALGYEIEIVEETDVIN